MKIDRMLFSGAITEMPRPRVSQLEWWAILVGVTAAGALAAIGLMS